MRPCTKTVCQTFLENYFLFIKSLIRLFEGKKKMVVVTLLSHKERRRPEHSGNKLLLREGGGVALDLRASVYLHEAKLMNP